MKTILTSLLFFMSAQTILGQQFRLSLANGLLQQQENLISSAVYQGYKFGILANYDRPLPNNRTLVLSGTMSASISSWNQFNNELFQLDGSGHIAYLLPVKSFWQVGPTAKARYQKNLYSLDYGHPFWFTQYSLGVFNRLSYPITKKNRIAANFAIPLIGLYTSTPDEPLYDLKQEYTQTFHHNNLQVATLANFRALDLQISISHELSKKKTVELGYAFNSFRYQNNKVLKSITNSFIIGLQFNFPNEK